MQLIIFTWEPSVTMKPQSDEEVTQCGIMGVVAFTVDIQMKRTCWRRDETSPSA